MRDEKCIYVWLASLFSVCLEELVSAHSKCLLNLGPNKNDSE